MKRILVVDDEPSIREALALVLEGEGYDVVTASNGREAIERIEQRRPDVLLLDVMMPVMDGLTACEVIRSTTPVKSLPIVLMTAAPDFARKSGVACRWDAFVEKPFDVAVLLDAIERATTAARDGRHS